MSHQYNKFLCSAGIGQIERGESAQAGALPGMNIAAQVSRDGGKTTIHNAKLMLRAGSQFLIDDVATSLTEAIKSACASVVGSSVCVYTPSILLKEVVLGLV
jgi:hypothetical protein